MSTLTLEMPDTLHHQLEWQARREGVSLDQYVLYTLARQTAFAYTIHAWPDEVVKEQRAKLRALWEGLPEASLSDIRQILARRDSAIEEVHATTKV